MREKSVGEKERETCVMTEKLLVAGNEGETWVVKSERQRVWEKKYRDLDNQRKIVKMKRQDRLV